MASRKYSKVPWEVLLSAFCTLAIANGIKVSNFFGIVGKDHMIVINMYLELLH